MPGPHVPQAADALGGRQRLIEAALQLASTTRSLASLGLREVARYAGLNPNTFYRHFKDFDELGLAAIQQLGGDLRRGLRERRQRPALMRTRVDGAEELADLVRTGHEVVHESVGLVLDFVTEHRTAYVVGIREMHGTSAALRQALRGLLDEMARDLAEDAQVLLSLPDLTPSTLEEISRQVIRQMTFFSMDYLEQDRRRDDIRYEAERFILRMFFGEIARQTAARDPDALARAAVTPASGRRPRRGSGVCGKQDAPPAERTARPGRSRTSESDTLAPRTAKSRHRDSRT